MFGFANSAAIKCFFKSKMYQLILNQFFTLNSIMQPLFLKLVFFVNHTVKFVRFCFCHHTTVLIVGDVLYHIWSGMLSIFANRMIFLFQSVASLFDSGQL